MKKRTIKKRESYRKKGLSYIENVEWTLTFLLSMKGRYSKKVVRWNCKNMLCKLRNAKTLLGEK